MDSMFGNSIEEEVFRRIEAAALASENRRGEEEDDKQQNLAEKAREYLERRRLREAQKKEEDDYLEKLELRDKPQINKNSARIAMERRRGEDTNTALYAEAEYLRWSKELLAEEHHNGEFLGHPAITKQAAELVREGNVSDRLYQIAMEKLRREREDQESHRSQPSQPKDRIESALRHTEDLYHKALEQKKAREDAEKSLKEELRRSAKPKLSHRTQQIAKELGQTSKERLLQQKAENAREQAKIQAKEVTKPHDRNLTFQPKINPKSRELVKDKDIEVVEVVSPTGRRGTKIRRESAHERLYHEHSDRTARRSSMSVTGMKSQEERDLEECTFHPTITGLPPQKGFRDVEDDRDLLDRMAEWEHNRALRLEYQRKQKQDEGLGEECTFKPNTTHSKVRRASTGGSLDSRRGVDQYLARQKKAREEKERIERTQKPSTKWSNRITVPVGPSLGTQRRRSEKEAAEKALEEEKSLQRTGKANPKQTRPPKMVASRLGSAKAAPSKNPSLQPVKEKVPLSAKSPKHIPTRAPPPPPPPADDRSEDRVLLGLKKLQKFQDGEELSVDSDDWDSPARDEEDVEFIREMIRATEKGDSKRISHGKADVQQSYDLPTPPPPMSEEANVHGRSKLGKNQDSYTALGDFQVLRSLLN